GDVKQRYPGVRIGFVGAHGAVLPEQTLREAPAVEFVCGNEFDYTLVEIAEGRPLAEVNGITFRAEDGSFVTTPARAAIHDLEAGPCTANRRRTEETAPMLGSLGMTWSCNSRANGPYETLRIMRENGLRLLLVGFESGNDRILRNIKKGVMVERMVRFMKDCKKLGIRVHGTFILGLPGETMETIRQTMEFAMAIDPETIQVSLAAPYPGTELYAQANGWLISEEQLLTDNGTQDFPLQYPGLGRREVFDAVDEFYRKFYFRPKPILRIVKDMVKDSDVRRRRLREGKEFFQYLRRR